ncbi:MAG TPA: hypothetical protein VGY57_04270, partial [Vicinamibacterales bacterium]|nr:hypothetical protein [Vicinamibacterales bacterium]
AEEAFLRERFAFTRPVNVAAPVIDAGADAAAVDEIVGTGEFALVHAPIAPSANQLPLIRAAVAAAIPLVVLGNVADVAYYQLLEGVADEHVRFVPDGDPRATAAIYRRARLFADVSWVSPGLHRAARAAACGAALLLSTSNDAAPVWGPGLTLADPASHAGVAQNFTAAWHSAQSEAARACSDRVAAYCDPVLSLSAVAGAYASAHAARVTA